MELEAGPIIHSQAQFLAKRIELKPDFEQFSDRRTKVDLSAPTTSHNRVAAARRIGEQRRGHTVLNVRHHRAAIPALSTGSNDGSRRVPR